MEKRMLRPCLLVALAAFGCRQPSGLDLSRYETVDLSHAYSPATLYWPTSPGGFT